MIATVVMHARARAGWVVYGAALAVVLLITLMPSLVRLTSGQVPLGCSWALYPGLSEERVLNVLLFVPLGAACVLAPRRGLAVVVALAAPFVIESAQAVLPLGRVCDVTDLVTNLTGLLVGLALGLLVVAIAHLGRRLRS